MNGANLAYTDAPRGSMANTKFGQTDDFPAAYMIPANLNGVNLVNADLTGADLQRAQLVFSDLTNADLSCARVIEANFKQATLTGAKLRHCELYGAQFFGTALIETDFAFARAGANQFLEVDLHEALNLETMEHSSPSVIGVETLYLSRAMIPEALLRGAGVPERLIEYLGSLITLPIEFYSCFIRYSNKECPFVDRLYTDLQARGVRCWFAPEDMKMGDRIRVRIDESIRLHDKLLLVLSGHSLASSWVEQEVETALERERRHGKTVLFPIRLDDAVMKVETGWPALIRNTRHIGDFTRWKDYDAYQAAFERLLRDLKAEGGR